MDLRARILWFAADWRLKRDKPFLIAITGSIAKTSTKEAVGAVLRAAYGDRQVRVGYGNLNTELGLPLAILGFEVDFYKQRITWQWLFLLLQALVRGLVASLPRYLVLEAGADKPGDLSRLTRHIRPDIAVVTIIGEAHLMNYTSQEALAKEKAELLRAVKRDGAALVNRRDPFRTLLASVAAAPVVEFDCQTENIAHTIAQTIGRQLRIKDTVIGEALSSGWQPAGRLQIHSGRFTVIDDSYNASPVAMKAALEKLGTLPKRRVAILGSMLELGGEEKRYHAEIGQYARQYADFVIGVGELARGYQPDQWFPSSDEAAPKVVAFLQKGDSILVKGSHGIRTDLIVKEITESEERS